MVYTCDNFSELKIVIRCVLVASLEALTIDELWRKVIHVFGGPHCVPLNVFGYNTPYELLQAIPDVVQLEDMDNENSIVNLISSDLSRHMEVLVSTNIIRPPSLKNKSYQKELLVPYRTQCAFIRIIYELYPEGLTINEFVTDILCIPIFKSFIDRVEILLYNLDHIFQKIGLEKIKLQPIIIKNLENVQEEDTYTAEDIYNIEEYSLEDVNQIQKIAVGLEYPLFILLEEQIKKNIALLLTEESGWVSETKICKLYMEKFGSTFVHFRRWGFCRVSQMFSKLPELCCVHFLKDDIEIISAKIHSCDIYKKKTEQDIDEELDYVPAKDTSENECDEDDRVLKKFLRNDLFLKASLNDCFLDQEIPHFDLKINESLNVHICRVNTNIVPTIICQCYDESKKFKNLITDMKKFYFMNEAMFLFDSTLTMVKQTYAFYLDDMWFRGIVTDINLNSVKMIDIDQGFTHDIPYDDIRILSKQFSDLPAQAITCYLHGIGSINEDEMSNIVDKQCSIYVVSFDHLSKTASVKIKLINSTSDGYLNDEWIKNGVAEPSYSSDEE